MNARIITVGSTVNRQKRVIPRIRISGIWLEEAGFSENMLFIAEFCGGGFTLTLKGEGMETYKKEVANARANNMQLLQVGHCYQNNVRRAIIVFKGVWVENLGFTIGDVLAVQYSYGIIRIKRVDFDKL